MAHSRRSDTTLSSSIVSQGSQRLRLQQPDEVQHPELPQTRRHQTHVPTGSAAPPVKGHHSVYQVVDIEEYPSFLARASGFPEAQPPVAGPTSTSGDDEVQRRSPSPQPLTAPTPARVPTYGHTLQLAPRIVLRRAGLIWVNRVDTPVAPREPTRPYAGVH